MVGQRKTVKIFMLTETFTKPERILQHVFNHNCFLIGNFYTEYIMRNAGLDEAQAGIKIAGRNINHLRYADNTTLMAESEEELESLDESERGELKSWLKAQHSENEDHGIWSHDFMANRWGNNGNSERLYLRGLQNQCRW